MDVAWKLSLAQQLLDRILSVVPNDDYRIQKEETRGSVRETFRRRSSRQMAECHLFRGYLPCGDGGTVYRRIHVRQGVPGQYWKASSEPLDSHCSHLPGAHCLERCSAACSVPCITVPRTHDGSHFPTVRISHGNYCAHLRCCRDARVFRVPRTCDFFSPFFCKAEVLS
jgi:hypothetical protein